MNEYWGKLRWCFDEGSNTDIVDDIGVIDVLDVSMEKTEKFHTFCSIFRSKGPHLMLNI